MYSCIGDFFRAIFGLQLAEYFTAGTNLLFGDSVEL